MQPSGRDTRHGMALVMLASTLWGTSGAASHLISQLAATGPLSLSFLRMATAAPVLLLVMRQMPGKPALSRRDFALIMLMGALIALDQTLYFAAITYAGVAVSTLLTICAAPVLVTLLTAVFTRRRPDNPTLALIALALVGTVLLVTGSQNADLHSTSLTGVLLALAAAGVYAFIILLGRFLAARCHPLQVTAIGFTTGAVLLGILAGLTGFAGNYPAAGWALIVYMGMIPTALAYSLFVVGMRTTPAPIASVLTLMEPLTATLVAWLPLGERFGIAGMIGAALLLLAIYLLARRG